MALLNELQAKRGAILELATKYGAKNIRVFGSVIRGEETAASDVDLLVDFEPGTGLLEYSRLLEDLQTLLGRKVDVVSEKNLYWLLKRRILKEARPL